MPYDAGSPRTVSRGTKLGDTQAEMLVRTLHFALRTANGTDKEAR